MKFQLTSDVITISSRTSTRTENVRSQLMQLLAVLVGNNSASRGSSVCSEAHSALFISYHGSVRKSDARG